MLRYAALVLLSGAAFAHDLWMIEEKGRVLVRIGEDFPVAVNGITEDRVVFLRAAGCAQEVVLEGKPEDKQFAAVLPDCRPLLVELEVKARLITLKAPDFSRYIRGEGFDSVIEARRGAGKSDAPGLEKYSRYAKLLLGGMTQTVRGHRLEIVPESWEGADLPVRVLFEGKPLARAWVSAGPAGMKGHKFPARVRTDGEGRAKLAIRSKGLWYARLIHMIPSVEPDAEWRSFFATLTFTR